ncbi:ROK family transcriptional regulator [Streptomyces maremycinicus]|uniref:ROK family transcriptional regulator n=1 Tax=Streptomyces maremycinicus TaxID=1679753 RepID=UPI000789A99A|nr:ROK family transcriptional regulator [Streptomyces sp. NBRC 110468]
MPASPSTARAINDRLALRLLQHEGPLTAGQLKQLTGLSRPSVADLVERLTASGLIEVVGEAGEQRRGPNAKLYGIVADRARLAALDVRTEGVAVLVSDLVGRVLAEASVPIGGDTGTGTAVEQAVSLVERAVKDAEATVRAVKDAEATVRAVKDAEATVRAVKDAEATVQPADEGLRPWGRLHTLGIGAPGLIDPASGELRDSSGLPEWHRRLVAALHERFPHAHAHVENETNLAALAEQREGAARDRDTFVLLWLGHGTGAAVVLDGALRRGASGGTGEIGFLPVPGTDGLPSATDCEGGFHSLAGSAAIAALAGEYGLTADARAAEPVAAALVRAAVKTPDTGAAAGFLDALADRLALGAASVVAVLDPGCVVLGGEVGQAGGEVLASRVARRLRRMAPLPTEVRAGVLGGGAVLRGALLTARDAAQEELFATAHKPEAHQPVPAP